MWAGGPRAGHALARTTPTLASPENAPGLPYGLDLRFKKLPGTLITPQPVQVPLLATLLPSGLELSTVQVTV